MRFPSTITVSMLFFGLLLSQPGVGGDQHGELTVQPDWLLTGLDSPESVIPNADGSFLYLSNVNGEGDAKDGNGYISRVSLQGDLLEQEWATGLNGPKGLALVDSILYVSDIDQLVLINTGTGELKSQVPVPEAGFLNDVASADNGILISDSANARIYSYSKGVISVWLEDERLRGVNGLLPQKGRLLATTMDKGELLSIDWNTKDIDGIAKGMTNADGLAELNDGSFLVSSWPGKLYHIKADQEPIALLDTEADEIYLNDFYIMDGAIIMPNWQPGSVRAFKLVREAP